MTRVVVLGAECTGKTALVEALADHYGCPWVPEAARLFVERERREVRSEDVEALADMHLNMAAQQEGLGSGLVLYDTDLLMTIVYARHYFGTCPGRLVRMARRRRADFYLLTGTDVPWQAEALQRGRLSDRTEVQARITTALKRRKWPYALVQGSPAERFERARRGIDRVSITP